MEPREHRLTVAGVGLSVLELGAADAPPLLMLHGMRDVAWSLLPTAEILARQYRVLLPELRGHGGSDQPGSYAIDHFLFDLYHVAEQLAARHAALFGHSLGGQIAARYAAVFPERVRALIMVEGLGPPARPGADDAAGVLREHGEHLLNVLGIPQSQRPLPDVAFAADRLLANNPRLDPVRALALAEHATRRSAAGDLVWAFDPRVRSVFLGVPHGDAERYWRQVRCPTLVVSGGLAHEYWRTQMSIEWDGTFAPGELENRVRCFPDAEHVIVPDAGHMVHYDREDAVTHAVADFLESKL
jgi:pimeloyl-ACP methyl ester carboxylesterase